MFSGNVSGTFVDLDEGKKVVMKWRLKHWPQGHHSEATMALEQELVLYNLSSKWQL